MYKSLKRQVPTIRRRLKLQKQLLLAAAMLLGCMVVQAQTIFPVQSTTRILPPYSVYLADYAVNGNDKLQCILVNRDATQTTYQVRLRLTVKLNGTVIMRTNYNYNPAPITLTPGLAQIFAGATLEPYLKSENLDFVGYSQELYEQNRALPEGFYEIGFAAYDYYRQDVQVSNDGWGFYFLAKNEPPLINMPSCGAKLQPQYSTPIRFSWMPRNTASLNSSNTTIYRYFLYEVNPQGVNPNDIVNSLPPIYIDSTPINQTFYDLMPATTLLRDNYVYAWRVQAVDINGADLFRNNGFSEVCTFTWGGPGANPYGSLDSVLNLNAMGETERKGKMWWTKDVTKFDGYKIHYKKAGNGYNWFTTETINDTLRVLDLEPDTEYECRLQGRKNGSFGMYSEVRYFRTKKITLADCSNMGEVPIVTNGRPMLNLAPGAVLTYRDFQIRVTDSIIMLSPGHFGGKGEVSLPFLAGLTFAVRFSDITIDDAGVISQGEVQFVTRDVLSWWAEHREEQDGGNNSGDVVTGSTQVDHTTDYDIPSPSSIRPVLPIVNGVTSIIITRPNGTKDTLENVRLPYTIQDSNGEIFSVDQNGNVVRAGQAGGLPGLNPTTVNKIDTDKIKVTFKTHPSQIYGFDAWQGMFEGKVLVSKEYEKLTDSTSNAVYYVANKAIGAAKSDKVIAKIEVFDAQNYKADSVRFATAKGTVFVATKTSTPGEYEVNLIGGPPNDAQELFALYPKGNGQYTTVGKLKIAGYDRYQKHVVLIPVQDEITDIVPIQQYLNKLYGSVNVEILLRQESRFEYTGWDRNRDGALDIAGSGLFNQYTAEMKSLNTAFKGQRNPDASKLYLFVMKKASGANAVGGDMPRGSQFGYLFTDALGTNKNKIGRTIAHELGHGTFNLKHTFDESIALPEKSTDNIMDYTDNYNAVPLLYKYQWDQIHDPGIVDKIFEGDPDGLSITYDITKLEPFKNNDNTYTFITPSGKYIMLPAGIQSVTFSTLDRLVYMKDEKPADEMTPLGALSSFIDQMGDAYSAHIKGITFKGYLKDNTENIYYKDDITHRLSPANKPISGIASFVGIKANHFIGYISKFPSIKPSLTTIDSMTGERPLLTDLSVVDFTEADMNKTISQVMNEKKVHGILKEYEDISVFFSNRDIVFNYFFSDRKLNEFLLEVIKEDGKLKDYLGWFVFANIKKNEMQAFATCLASQFSNDIQLLSTRIRAAINEAQYGESGRLSRSRTMFDNIKAKTLEELLGMTNADMSVVTLLRNAKNAGASASELHTIIKTHYVPCAFGGIDYETRKYVLEKFLGVNSSNDNWYTSPTSIPFVSDGSFILKPFILSTPFYDRAKLLKEGFKSNNYAWLRKLWDGATGRMNGVGYGDVSEVLNVLGVWVTQHFKDLDVKITTKMGFVEDVPGFKFHEYPAGSNDYYIGMQEDENYYTGSNNSGLNYKFRAYTEPSDIDFQNDGKINFEQNYWMEDVSLSYNDPNSYRPDTRFFVDYDETFDPFEPVNITIADNWGELDLTKGDKFTVPAFIAMLYDKNVKRNESDHRLRKILDGVMIAAAVLLAPETGGGSFAVASNFVARVTIVASSIDLLLEQERANLSPQDYQASLSFYNAWDQFKTAVDYSNIGVAIVGAAPKIISAFSRVNVIKGWNRFTTFCRTNYIRLTTQGRSAWNTIKSFGSTLSATGTVTREIVKAKLPTEFIDALKAFGKTETEILDYFVTYQNTRSLMKFFDDMDNYMASGNFANLTKAEAFAVSGYTTNMFFGQLNEWLRLGSNAGNTALITNLINSGLAKLANYSGQYVFRGIVIEQPALSNFLAEYASGAIKTWDNFTSCGGSLGASFAGRDYINVIFRIKHLNGKDISNFADGIRYGGMPAPEILIKSGSRMRVTAAPTFDNALQKWIIEVEQVF